MSTTNSRLVHKIMELDTLKEKYQDAISTTKLAFKSFVQKKASQI